MTSQISMQSLDEPVFRAVAAVALESTDECVGQSKGLDSSDFGELYEIALNPKPDYCSATYFFTSTRAVLAIIHESLASPAIHWRSMTFDQMEFTVCVSKSCILEVSVQLYSQGLEQTCVEFRRLDGDAFAFRNFFDESLKQLSSLKPQPSPHLFAVPSHEDCITLDTNTEGLRQLTDTLADMTSSDSVSCAREGASMLAKVSTSPQFVAAAGDEQHGPKLLNSLSAALQRQDKHVCYFVSSVLADIALRSELFHVAFPRALVLQLQLVVSDVAQLPQTRDYAKAALTKLH